MRMPPFFRFEKGDSAVAGVYGKLRKGWIPSRQARITHIKIGCFEGDVVESRRVMRGDPFQEGGRS